MNEIERAKYPRTYHFAWSPGTTSDDRFLSDMSVLEGCDDLVVTVKMDGENTTIYPDGYYHARSMTSEYHPSRGHIGQIAANIMSDLPEGWRICGENLWAVHSIEYHDLPSAFMVFSIWNGDTCLDWDTTVEWAELLGLQMVPTIYRGPWPGEQKLQELFEPYRQTQEGYVVRVAKSFHIDDFSTHVGKWVRKGHVQTDQHWKVGAVRRNGVVRS